MVQESQTDIEQIQKEYERRNAQENKEYNLLFSPSAHLIKFRRGFNVCEVLLECFPQGLANMRVLDVGCGTGSFLSDLRSMGAQDRFLYGIDLSKERCETAKQRYPDMNFTLGNGNLPYGEDKFELVSAFTVFSSILNDKFRRELARDCIEAVKDEGFILIYDFVYNNPANDKVRAVTPKNVKEMFPNCDIGCRSLTLAPPLSRRISKVSVTAAYLMERFLPFLRTHKLYVISKKK